MFSPIGCIENIFSGRVREIFRYGSVYGLRGERSYGKMGVRGAGASLSGTVYSSISTGKWSDKTII